MKAIFINAKERTVKEVNINNDISEMKRLIECSCFTVGHEFDNGDAVYIDDEGLYHPTDFFELGDACQPFAGNGLVVGYGDGSDCKTSIEDIKDDIMWFDVATLLLRQRIG